MFEAIFAQLGDKFTALTAVPLAVQMLLKVVVHLQDDGAALVGTLLTLPLSAEHGLVLLGAVLPQFGDVEVAKSGGTVGEGTFQCADAVMLKEVLVVLVHGGHPAVTSRHRTGHAKDYWGLGLGRR